MVPVTYEGWVIDERSTRVWTVRKVDGMHMVDETGTSNEPAGAFAQALRVINAKKWTLVSVVPLQSGWIVLVGKSEAIVHS